MQNKLTKAIDKFYHDMSIIELNLQNNNTLEDNLTYNDILYLSIIEAHDGEYTASKIADLLNVARPSVTQKINELVKKGYILKKQCENDKRVHFLHLNPQKMFCTKNTGIESEIYSSLLKDYSNNDLDNFFEILEKITAMYKAKLTK